jgi:hypothetical protein
VAAYRNVASTLAVPCAVPCFILLRLRQLDLQPQLGRADPQCDAPHSSDYSSRVPSALFTRHHETRPESQGLVRLGGQEPRIRIKNRRHFQEEQMRTDTVSYDTRYLLSRLTSE